MECSTISERIEDRYYVDKISKKSLQHIIKTYHYIHKLRGASYAYGLYDKEQQIDKGLGSFPKLIGCIMFSVPAAKQICYGICGEEFRDQVIELSRLWIEDGTMKNLESWFISRAMAMVPKDIIISYADPTANHRGTIYQATNFIYTGLSGGGKDMRVKGMGEHSRGTPKIGGYEALCKKYGKENVIVFEKVQKHRYIFFNCGKQKRKMYMKRLKWPIKPYPKSLPSKDD